MLATLRLAYFGLLIYCLVFFVAWTAALLSNRRKDHSVPKGSGLLGMLSAFTRGMLPWRKESARLHPLSYVAGILYHMATFTSLAILGFPRFLYAGSGLISVLLLAGLASGFYLLFKRVFDRRYRLMSQFDDYFSNLLVDAMQLSVVLSVLGAVPVLVPYGVAYLVLLYLPFGKLKHCYFFFASRLLLGRSYGRRGVYI